MSDEETVVEQSDTTEQSGTTEQSDTTEKLDVESGEGVDSDVDANGDAVQADQDDSYDVPLQKPDSQQLQRIIEGALLAAGKPMSIKQLSQLFVKSERPTDDDIQTALDAIQSEIEGRGFELKQIASGYRFQVIQDVSLWVSRMWDEKPQKYSRALLETLSLIAYRQPITRGDIEDIRGVAVSSHIIKTLMEREWIRVVGHKDVPGRPAMFATTRLFLDYFNLKSLDELPSLAEIRDLDSMNGELALEGADTPPVDTMAKEAGLDDETQAVATPDSNADAADQRSDDLATVEPASVESNCVEPDPVDAEQDDGKSLALFEDDDATDILPAGVDNTPAYNKGEQSPSSGIDPDV